MSSKVRYYLEQSVPELEDLQKKGLFDKQEINLVMRRRTDFEHRLSSRGSKPRDYLKYVEFETNLEKLRSKRYSRLSSVGLVHTKPSISDWASERRITFIYDRGVQKFPNDFQIWENYISFAKKQKMFKKIYKIYTQLLQLHPTSIASWISAANFEFEYVGSAKNARTLFQRSLRFNKDSKKLWLTYTIFELSYITKLLNRRKILGLMTEKQQLEHEASEKKAMEEDGLIELPGVTDSELKGQLNSLPDVDMNMLGNPETNPALRGDVALTVFDVCMETLFKLKTNTNITEFEFKYDLCQEFLGVFDKFEALDRLYLGQHVVNYLIRQFAQEPKSVVLDVTLPLRNATFHDENLIEVLQAATKKYMAYKAKAQDREKSELKSLFSQFLSEKFLQDTSIEDKTKQIIVAITKRL
jgi:U3 small nucleolar RNA-associated protein 6